MFQVEVRSRIVGAAPEDRMSNVILDMLNETITIRELIALAVEEQIRDLLMDQQMTTDKLRRILNRQYLTPEDIDQVAETGTVQMPNKKGMGMPDKWGKTHEKLFLPFTDDDFKTSEVISKILLLLADDKIKDKSILRQIEAQHSAV
jgi:hypothetical protein